MSKRFSIEVDSLMHEKILDYNKKNGISRVQVVQQALEFFFEKQDEKEIINAILQRLDEIKSISIKSEIYSVRANCFLNNSSEVSMDTEDYKKLREKVLKEMNTYLSSRGYDK